MTNRQFYFGIENLGLNSSQRQTLIEELKTLGPASDPQPACLCHWRTRLDGDAAIFEALFNENNLTVDKFKQRLGTIFSVDPSTIDHSLNQVNFAGHGTQIAVFSRGGTDYLRFALFGGMDADWMDSGDECRGYLMTYHDEWDDLL